MSHGDEETEQKEAPTLAAFSTRFIEDYAKGNRQKPSSVDSKQSIIDHHLIPLFGSKRLEELTEGDLQKLRARLKNRSPKTVNNVLCVLSKLLKVAVKWKELAVMPVSIELLKYEAPEMEFYEAEQYEGLVGAASRIDRRTLITILLGGDAGFRTGEMLALEWTDIDFRRRRVTISRSEWKGEVTVPKGGKAPTVGMTPRLAQALEKFRHPRGKRVLYRDDNTPCPNKP